MYKDILEVLKCPECSNELSLEVKGCEDDEIIEGNLICSKGHEFTIVEGIINFGSKEQDFSNSWSEAYDENSADEVEQKILKETPNNQIVINNKTKKFIIESINEKDNRFLLDIAAGRGELLREIVKEVNDSTHIICIDLSHIVLMHTRLRIKKINPNIKVSYIACDATNLALKDNTIDLAVSFYGIQNMLGVSSYGIRESKRVLKPGKLLLSNYIVIEKDSNGFKTLESICSENNISNGGEFCVKSSIEKAYSNIRFDEIDIITIEESIGCKNEFDLLPFENEWFAGVVVKAMK